MRVFDVDEIRQSAGLSVPRRYVAADELLDRLDNIIREGNYKVVKALVRNLMLEVQRG